jgi:tetratricopeptide (TPR) repeat protein
MKEKAKHWALALAKGLDLVEFYDMTAHAVQSVQGKVEAIQSSEEEKERLTLENAHLRVKLESMVFQKKMHSAEDLTKAMGLRLNKETGSKVGRTLAGIQYQPPSQLTMPQMLVLAESYFKQREDEKAAVIFTLLTGLENSDNYKSPKYYLMTGIAWYRLDNFEVAEMYFDKVMEVPENEDTRRFLAQTRLWKGITAWRTGKNQKAQYWLRDLVDHHPHSMEARWVNPAAEVNRATASDDEE